MPAIIRIGLIELEHREFGIVLRRDPLIAEIAVDFVDSLDAADQQALQIKFRSDSQIEIDVERVVMRDKRPRRCAAVQRLHHRSFDFQEAARYPVAAATSWMIFDRVTKTFRTSGFAIRSRYRCRYRVSTSSRPCHFSGSASMIFERKKISSTCTVSSPVFVRNRYPADADDVADIEQLVQFVIGLADRILLDVDLQLLAVLE